MTETTVFICGKPRDHECNSEGPEMFGGEDANGESWISQNPAPEIKAKASWGSVSCSICGMTSMERAMWEGP